jgi:tetratricopeptide (TPR) repeat protein
MMNELSRIRRFAVAAVALLCAGLVFRSQIAQALIIRGDDYLYRGDQPAALQRYQRALLVAPWSQAAADRYVFVSMQQQTAQSTRAALVVANRYLSSHPHDAVLLADRALWYLHARRYSAAQRDLAAAAESMHSVTDYVFAGFAAEHAHHHDAALALWRTALKEQPGYEPAQMALAEHGR